MEASEITVKQSSLKKDHVIVSHEKKGSFHQSPETCRQKCLDACLLRGGHAIWGIAPVPQPTATSPAFARYQFIDDF